MLAKGGPAPYEILPMWLEVAMLIGMIAVAAFFVGVVVAGLWQRRR